MQCRDRVCRFRALLEGCGIDAHTTGRTAGVGGEREAKHVHGFVAAPKEGTLTAAEPAEPVAA